MFWDSTLTSRKAASDSDSSGMNSRFCGRRSRGRYAVKDDLTMSDRPEGAGRLQNCGASSVEKAVYSRRLGRRTASLQIRCPHLTQTLKNLCAAPRATLSVIPSQLSGRRKARCRASIPACQFRFEARQAGALALQ